MLDPFPYPPPSAFAKSYIQALANTLHLKTLPLHYHQILFAFTLYHVTNKYLAPAFSRAFFPTIYNSFNARTKLNWDVHIVSFVQSTLINALALWVIWNDEERAEMNWQGRVWGYTGGSGLIQGFAAGYFVWDLLVTVQNLGVFGMGMLAHAVSALFVFSLGFRPFVNFYAPTFILYELSSPFLNIHWFCDKLNLTGTKIQLYNGILLLFTFFSCRLCWGTYQSIRVFSDIYRALTLGRTAYPTTHILPDGTLIASPTAEMMRFGDDSVPLWLAGCYLLSNLTLNGLNWYWFGKMISTLRKRFDAPLGTRKPVKAAQTVAEKMNQKYPEEEDVYVEGTHIVTPGARTPVESGDYMSAVSVEKGANSLKVRQSEVRTRTTRRHG